MCICAGLAHHSSVKKATVFVTAHFETQQCTASCVKDSGKVRSHGWRCENVSLVSRREDKLCGELPTGFIRSADTLSNSRHLSLSWGTGGHVVPVWLCVSVCEHMCFSGWGADSDTLYTSRFSPVFIQIWPSTRTNTYCKCALLSHPSHSATLLCWSAVESPPNMSTRTILCYGLWKELEQFRKHPPPRPDCGLGMIGVECKWLWSLWQSTLFVNDWVGIWGEETGSDSCD